MSIKTLVFLGSVTMVMSALNHHRSVESQKECNCFCSEDFEEGLSICQKLSRFHKDLFALRSTVEYRTRYITKVDTLEIRVDLQEITLETLQNEIELLKKQIAGNVPLPSPQSLTGGTDYNMQNDGAIRTADDDRGLSDLLAKMEAVENKTNKVQEELKSERRVRRSLEEELNETRSSVKILDDKLLNVTLPMDSRVSHVEEVVFSTLENMNKTLFEDHLQMLYYKVNGVVYENETRKLDQRLDQVESELREVSNFSAFINLEEEVKILAENFNELNSSIKETLTADESRLEMLENKTNNIEKLEVLDTAIGSLLTRSGMLSQQIISLWNDIKEVQNKTVLLEKELNGERNRNEETLKTLEASGRSFYKNISSELNAVRSQMKQSDQLVSAIEKKTHLLSVDVSATENHIVDLAVLSETRFQGVYFLLQNLTEEWNETVTNLAAQISEMKSTDGRRAGYFIQELVTDMYPADEVEIFTRNDDVFGNLNIGGTESVPCSLPSVNDEHLLVTMEKDKDGNQHLNFGCHPIGRYALMDTLVQVTCINGLWHGEFPTCIPLLDEQGVKNLEMELKKESPCLKPDGTFPDPVDCTRFYSCASGTAHRIDCPKTLHFNALTSNCDYPEKAKCIPSFNATNEGKLKDVIPTIEVDPDIVDKPFGLMGTGDKGQLIVYPRTTFTLHCLYPENAWGNVSWYENLKTDPSNVPYSKTGKNRVSLTVTAATEANSGWYTCRTPFGKQNSVLVVVKAVQCPEMQLRNNVNRDLVYKSHPDGEPRILSTSAQFQCEGGSKVTAYCLANGMWSREPPALDECPQKEPQPAATWKCPPIDISSRPGLIQEEVPDEFKVSFKCKGDLTLRGLAHTRCTDDGKWSHTSLPYCRSSRKF